VFETDDQSELVILPWVLRYFLQLLCSYPAVSIAIIPFSAVLSRLGFSGELSSNKFFAGYEALLCLFVGPFIGWIVGHLKPSFVSSGRWIWILPAMIIVPDMVRQLLHQSIPWIPEYFFATNANERLGVYLGTLPTCSAVGYSIGMFFTRVRRFRSVIKAAIVTIAGVALFCLFASLLRKFENSRLESWARVRTVIDRAGLPFSADVRLLCGPKDLASSRAFLLRSGTYVETLERRGCSEDQLVDVNALPPATVGNPGPFLLDRVRVLSGPLAGSEGWVLEYGLLEN
jgi:hypothetical protein